MLMFKGMTINESSEEKENIDGGGGCGIDEDENDDIKKKTGESIDEKTNKRLLFKKSIYCTIFFKSFTISIAFTAFTRRSFIGKSY